MQLALAMGGDVLHRSALCPKELCVMMFQMLRLLSVTKKAFSWFMFCNQ